MKTIIVTRIHFNVSEDSMPVAKVHQDTMDKVSCHVSLCFNFRKMPNIQLKERQGPNQTSTVNLSLNSEWCIFVTCFWKKLKLVLASISEQKKFLRKLPFQKKKFMLHCFLPHNFSKKRGSTRHD